MDVGGGTGFCTLGVVETVWPENVTLIDQSPHQLAKAKQKPQLQSVTVMEVRSAVSIIRWSFIVDRIIQKLSSHT